MAQRKVTAIPATIKKYTAVPIGSNGNAALPDMPVSPPTMKTRSPATRRR